MANHAAWASRVYRITGIPRYRVKRVVDSVEYTPGQFLRRDTVENLCAMNDGIIVVKEAKS
jgi:hypothetical protein